VFQGRFDAWGCVSAIESNKSGGDGVVYETTIVVRSRRPQLVPAPRTRTLIIPWPKRHRRLQWRSQLPNPSQPHHNTSLRHRRHESVLSIESLSARLGSRRSATHANYNTTTREHFTYHTSPDLAITTASKHSHNGRRTTSPQLAAVRRHQPDNLRACPRRGLDMSAKCSFRMFGHYAQKIETIIQGLTNVPHSSTSQPAPPTSPTSAS